MATPTLVSIAIPASDVQTERSYAGRRTRFGTVVEVRTCHGSYPLPSRLDLRNHSPTGFEWGYGGSGPSQLSLALLADFTQDDAYACARYQDLKWDVVCELPAQGWEITGDALQDWVRWNPLPGIPWNRPLSPIATPMPLATTERRRSHRRKRRYRTWEAAEAAAQEYDRRMALRFSPMQAYPCRYCPRYHIGHAGGRQA